MIPECKIYTDGNSFIAIPHTVGRKGPRRKKHEPLIEIIENPAIDEPDSEKASPMEVKEKPPTPEELGLVEVTDKYLLELFGLIDEEDEDEFAPSSVNVDKPEPQKPPPKGRLITKTELFNELYKKSFGMKKTERKNYIVGEMKPYFSKEEFARAYVDAGFDRKRRNLIARRVRIMRKIYLHGHWNYLATFTYDSAKLTEDLFRKKLRTCLTHFVKRKGWAHIGVWERSPVKQRLHLHALMDIPDGTMPGELIEVKDWDIKHSRQQTTIQNTFFNKKFGRTDFKVLDNNELYGAAMQYIVKYIEKTGERLVCSRGLSQFFISDVDEADILTNLNDEDKPPKYLLFDDFSCWDEGVYMGQVSAAIINQMRKVN